LDQNPQSDSLKSDHGVEAEQTSLLGVNCGLVDVQGIPPLECLSAEVTVVEKHPREVDRFQVVSDFGRQLGFEDIAYRAMVFFYRLVADNVLSQVVRR
jgi:hypothetical protein